MHDCASMRTLFMELVSGVTVLRVAIAIESYATVSDGRIPYGPTAPPFSSPAD